MSDIDELFDSSASSAGQPEMIAMAAAIVSAYVTNNSIPASELPSFVRLVYAGLGSIGQRAQAAEEIRKEPAVPIKKSITREYIICLEDGKKYQTLKRHLLTKYNLTPEQYRTKWELPGDYPMTAPAYSETRSAFAKAAGLGIVRGATASKTKPKTRAKKAA